MKLMHPHATSKVAIVHNGIIENYKEIIAGLNNKSLLNSETDSEVIAHLLTNYIDEGLDINKAIMRLLEKLKGAYAIGILISNENKLIAVRKGSLFSNRIWGKPKLHWFRCCRVSSIH